MPFQLLSLPTATTLLVIIFVLIVRRLRSPGSLLAADRKSDYLDIMVKPSEPKMLSKTLAEALPDSVIFPHDVAAFTNSMNSYWVSRFLSIHSLIEQR